MSKRRRGSDESDASTRKRRRDSSAGSIDRLSCLSNELLLHILSFLPISSLSVCQRYALGLPICRDRTKTDSAVTDYPVVSMPLVGTLNFGNVNIILNGCVLVLVVWPVLDARPSRIKQNTRPRSRHGLITVI